MCDDTEHSEWRVLLANTKCHNFIWRVKIIFADDFFRVSGDTNMSERKRQSSGFSQGCPLSLVLFVMVMTVLLRDAVPELGPVEKSKYDEGALSTLLHADDTLLIGYQGRPQQ